MLPEPENENYIFPRKGSKDVAKQATNSTMILFSKTQAYTISPTTLDTSNMSITNPHIHFILLLIPEISIHKSKFSLHC